MSKILFSFQKARYLPTLVLLNCPPRRWDIPRNSSAKTSRKFLGKKGLLACYFNVASLSPLQEFRNQHQSLQLHKVTQSGAKEEYNTQPLLGIRLQSPKTMTCNGRKESNHINTEEISKQIWGSQYFCIPDAGNQCFSVPFLLISVWRWKTKFLRMGSWMKHNAKLTLTYRISHCSLASLHKMNQFYISYRQSSWSMQITLRKITL